MRCAQLGPLSLALTLALGASPAAQAPQTTPEAKPVQPPAAGRGRQTAPPSGPKLALTVMVTALDGKTLPEVVVKATGPVDREAPTDPSGLVTFANMAPGTYRLRFEHSGFITFEKEISLAAGKPLRASASLSAAPPPPPPPKVEPTPAPPVKPAPPGSYQSVSTDIPGLFEKNLTAKQTAIGCTASSTSVLEQLREPLADHAHADADELIYVVAGEGTHKVADREYKLAGGVFSVVPRGVTHSIVRRGRQPLVYISTLSGPPCQPGQ